MTWEDESEQDDKCLMRYIKAQNSKTRPKIRPRKWEENLTFYDSKCTFFNEMTWKKNWEIKLKDFS